MKVWFDADNGPHVHILRPLIEEFSARGHEVIITARDRTNTCELLDLYGIPYQKIGGEYRRGMIGKVRGTLGRAWELYRVMRGTKSTVSFGHGSRALPMASRLLGIPSVTMYDYEWVNPRLFNLFCDCILLPQVITPARCRKAGIAQDKVTSFPGFKEELYLGGRDFDETIAADLGLRESATKVLLRPPATTAHYHNPEAEILLDSILQKLAASEDVQLVFLARIPDQLDLPGKAGVSEVIVPNKVYDGPSLIANMDMVISGGGTMSREAALLGVPSYSFFRGKSGMVDEALMDAGKLVMIETSEQVLEKMDVVPKQNFVTQPDPGPMVAHICNTIESAV